MSCSGRQRSVMPVENFVLLIKSIVFTLSSLSWLLQYYRTTWFMGIPFSSLSVIRSFSSQPTSPPHPPTHCTKNWIYSHLLMSKCDANAVQMCGKHGKCRIYSHIYIPLKRKQPDCSLMIANYTCTLSTFLTFVGKRFVFVEMFIKVM